MNQETHCNWNTQIYYQRLRSQHLWTAEEQAGILCWTPTCCASQELRPLLLGPQRHSNKQRKLGQMLLQHNITKNYQKEGRFTLLLNALQSTLNLQGFDCSFCLQETWINNDIVLSTIFVFKNWGEGGWYCSLPFQLLKEKSSPLPPQ